MLSSLDYIRVFKRYAQAKSETPPSGTTRCGEDALFSFIMCSHDFETVSARWVYPKIFRSSGIAVSTLSSSPLNDYALQYD